MNYGNIYDIILVGGINEQRGNPDLPIIGDNVLFHQIKETSLREAKQYDSNKICHVLLSEIGGFN